MLTDEEIIRLTGKPVVVEPINPQTPPQSPDWAGLEAGR